MKTITRLMAFAAAIFVAQVAVSQTGPPAGSTGQCKDGTYTSSASKSGACKGHQGIKEWYAAAPAAAGAVAPASSAAPAAPKAPPATAAAPAAPAAPAAKASSSTAAKTQAPGGGPGLVWLNSSTNVYHCPGTQYYGKTKEGSYMSEADAKAKGAHADHNKPCTK
jgi:hypothetical protein